MLEKPYTETEISFSMPDQLGTVMTIGDDSYEFHSAEGKLTDSFLDELIHLKEVNKFPYQFTLYDDNQHTDPVILSFPDQSHMTVDYQNIQKSYSVSFATFFESFTENVKKYAIYYAAPCNYRAMFFSSFDELVKKMEKYRDGEKKILNKLQ